MTPDEVIYLTKAEAEVIHGKPLKADPYCVVCMAKCSEAGYLLVKNDPLGLSPNWPYLRIGTFSFSFCTEAHLVDYVLERWGLHD